MKSVIGYAHELTRRIDRTRNEFHAEKSWVAKARISVIGLIWADVKRKIRGEGKTVKDSSAEIHDMLADGKIDEQEAVRLETISIRLHATGTHMIEAGEGQTP